MKLFDYHSNRGGMLSAADVVAAKKASNITENSK